jgi:hypothetical protein
MTEPPGDESALRRAAMREELRAAYAGCTELYLLLPQDPHWQGGASRAFRRRVIELNHGIDAAAAALRAAEATL